MRAKRHGSRAATVRVPEDQPMFFRVPGKHGGWFVSLLWGFGKTVDVPMAALRDLLDGSRGQVIVARRLVGAELRLLESYLDDIGAEVHARIISREEVRWRLPRKR